MILVIDNYDSFTYNLAQYIGQLGAALTVRRNDQISLEQIVEMNPAGVLLSPGPSTPSAAGVCLNVLSVALGSEKSVHTEFFASKPIFGVCLGCQSMGFVSGAEVVRAQNVMHGKTSPIRHDGKGVFAGMPVPFTAVRYHSLVIDPKSLSADFTVTATSQDDGAVMGVRHRTLPIEGVQFHPESVLTENGLQIIKNFVDSCT
jgi:anthranilate synthase/aminodeoxychorismate synthase-like glutamine amidotransferase